MVFWKSCLVLTVLTILGGSACFAQQSQLRWKTPKVGRSEAGISASESVLSQGDPVASSAVSLSRFESPKAGSQEGRAVKNPIQQVRFVRAPQFGEDPFGGPSREAVIDTLHPESRPEFSRNQEITTPNFTMPSVPSHQGSLYTEGELDRNIGDSFLEGAKRGNYRVIIECPTSGILKPITSIDHDIRLATEQNVPKECDLVTDDYYPIRNWNRICFMWKASTLCHKPFYFEDKALERYGHTYVREEFQPIVSGLRFFLTVPILPYKMGLNPPNECIYTLGDYRPGDCAPYMLDPLPISVRAGLIQAGVIVGGVAIFP